MREIKDAEVQGKRVLVRADLDVPLKGGEVADDWRLQSLVPTLEFLQAGGAHIIIIGHLGRPEGRAVEALKLAPVEKKLRELTAVPFEMKENLRFDEREEKNDIGFAKEMAAWGDVYVNEAFANSHRAHASMVLLPTLIPSFAGLRLAKEIKTMQEALQPAKPALAIMGGAKLETKSPLLEKLSASYEKILVGGALGNDLLKVRGLPVGLSLVGESPVPEAIAGNEKLLMPEDMVAEDEQGNSRAVHLADVRTQERIVDIGSATIERWSEEISKAQFVLWNGPLGFYEKGYRAGTEGIAEAIRSAGCSALIGGSDTVAAVRKVAFDEKKVFLSVGGGAMLQYLAGGTLPAVEVLQK